MQLPESITEYCRLAGRQWPAASQLAAYRIEEDARPASAFPHVRRDFYKVKLLRHAHGVLHYADQQISVQGDALVFVNPQIPYSWQELGPPYTGCTCLFTKEFITSHLKTTSVAYSPLFRVGGVPVLLLPPTTATRLGQLFEQLLAELDSEYANRNEVFSSYLHLILHEALKLVPVPPPLPGTAAAHLSARFLDLLERQFPVASPEHGPALRNANEYARQLGVHPNHLNKALKQTTSTTTTAHLAARLAAEAQALLRHSRWSLTDIAQCLGFEHPSNFAAFFKKHVGQPPRAYRRQAVAHSYPIA